MKCIRKEREKRGTKGYQKEKEKDMIKSIGETIDKMYRKIKK